MTLPGATASSAPRCLAGACAGAAITFAALALGRNGTQMNDWWAGAAGAGMLLYVWCGVVLSVGVWRRAKQMREAGRLNDLIAPATRQQRMNVIGSFVMGAGVLLGVWKVFGAPAFGGEWVLEFLLIFAGLIVQMQAQALYLRALG